MKYFKEIQDELIKNMNKNIKIKTINGLEQIIKPIPEGDDGGGVDKREKEALLRMLKFKGNNPVNEKPSIEILRKIFGTENIDISNNISTEDKIVIGRDKNEISLKIYRSPSEEVKPAFIFIHGGGFFAGSTKVVENACKYLAEISNAVVFSIDYRLSPENKFPAGLYDCYDSLLWIYNNSEKLKIDKNKIGIGGDSAGGNLATCVTILDREQKTNIVKFEALLYPCVLNLEKEIEDYKFDVNLYEYGNDAELAKKLVMMIKSLPSIGEYYVDDKSDLENKLISPILADNLSNMPPTLIITGEYDYLTLESEAYARKLIRNNVKVKYIKYKGVSHAIIDKIGTFPQAQDCIDEISNFFIETIK